MFPAMKKLIAVPVVRNLQTSHKSGMFNVFFKVPVKNIKPVTRETYLSARAFTVFNKEQSYIQKAPADVNKRIICFQGEDTMLSNQKRHFMENRKTKSVTIWEDLKEMKYSPLPALVLGLSGLLPFISAPGYMILSQLYMPSIAFAQTAYGACILSFLGGVRWGISVPDESMVRPDWFNLGYSVVPSLVAWVALLMPNTLSIFTIMSGLAATAYFDSTMWGYPPWFKGLRFLLSLVAVLSLWTTFMCSLMLNKSKAQKSEDKPEELAAAE